MAKGKAREWVICWRIPTGVPFTVVSVIGPIAQINEEIRVREVIPLADEEKQRVKKMRNMNTTESEAFLLDLLERAGVM